jgi:hypothetical protein
LRKAWNKIFWKKVNTWRNIECLIMKNSHCILYNSGPSSYSNTNLYGPPSLLFYVILRLNFNIYINISYLLHNKKKYYLCICIYFIYYIVMCIYEIVLRECETLYEMICEIIKQLVIVRAVNEKSIVKNIYIIIF